MQCFCLMITRICHDPTEHSHLPVQLIGQRRVLMCMNFFVCPMVSHFLFGTLSSPQFMTCVWITNYRGSFSRMVVLRKPRRSISAGGDQCCKHKPEYGAKNKRNQRSWMAMAASSCNLLERKKNDKITLKVLINTTTLILWIPELEASHIFKHLVILWDRYAIWCKIINTK